MSFIEKLKKNKIIIYIIGFFVTLGSLFIFFFSIFKRPPEIEEQIKSNNETVKDLKANQKIRKDKKEKRNEKVDSANDAINNKYQHTYKRKD